MAVSFRYFLSLITNFTILFGIVKTIFPSFPSFFVFLTSFFLMPPLYHFSEGLQAEFLYLRKKKRGKSRGVDVLFYLFYTCFLAYLTYQYFFIDKTLFQPPSLSLGVSPPPWLLAVPDSVFRDSPFHVIYNHHYIIFFCYVNPFFRKI